MYKSFEEVLSAYGIPLPKQDIVVGKFTRWGKNQRYWARPLSDSNGIAYGDWCVGISEVWLEQTNINLKPEEITQRQKQIERIRQEEERERESTHQGAITYAQEKWHMLSESGSSEYLIKKQINGYGIRFDSQNIVVPVCDIKGQLWGLQEITPDGRKSFTFGTKVKGNFHILGQLKTATDAYVVEGYATGASVYQATNKPVIIAFNAGNLLPVVTAIQFQYPALKISILGDNDCWKTDVGNIGKEKAEEVAKRFGLRVVFPVFKNTTSKPTDFNDLHCLEGLEVVKNQVQEKRLRVITIQELLTLEISPPEMILYPIIPKQGLGMLYGYRGRGKTFFTLGIAHAIATGTSFLTWKADKPRRVLVVDGEMAVSAMQERSNILIQSTGITPDPGYLRFITPDLQEWGIPSLHTLEGQHAIEDYLEGVDVLILDNISTLCRNGRENEAESWVPIQEWALKLRRKGTSVLFIHHAGKGETQRGTTKREDVLDTVIALKTPADYEESQGVRVEVHYEKHRHFYGDDAKPFEAQLITENGLQHWKVTKLEDTLLEQVVEMAKDGMKQREIALELEVSLAKVNRTLKQAKEKGIYKNNPFVMRCFIVSVLRW